MPRPPLLHFLCGLIAVAASTSRLQWGFHTCIIEVGSSPQSHSVTFIPSPALTITQAAIGCVVIRRSVMLATLASILINGAERSSTCPLVQLKSRAATNMEVVSTNLVFTLDHGQRIVARLPTRISGPPKLTTNSEVATIKYRA